MHSTANKTTDFFIIRALEGGPSNGLTVREIHEIAKLGTGYLPHIQGMRTRGLITFSDKSPIGMETTLRLTRS